MNISCKYPFNPISIIQDTSGKAARKSLLLADLLIFIFDNYSRSELNLEMIVEHLNCHKDYIYNVCAVFFGMGVMELVETVRLQKSVILIFSGEYKVWSKIGYNSIFVFSKAFKRRTGMNIIEARRRILNRSNEEIKNTYRELINIIWKGRYEILKEVFAFKGFEIKNGNWGDL